MNKFVSLIISGALVTSLVSCASSSGNSHPEPATDENGRVVITIGMPKPFATIMPFINRYNQSQEEYTLEVIDYTLITGNTNMPENYDYDDEAARMKLDLASGSAPDIICLNNEEMSDLIPLDMFCDMFELMDKYGEMSPDDLLPNVREGLTVNGKMPAIATNFWIRTFLAKASLVGENAENWTIDRFSEVCSDLPENIEKLRSYDDSSMKDDVFNFATTCLHRDCVDIIGGKCDFSSSYLEKCLELAESFKDFVDKTPDFETMTPEEMDSFLLEQQEISPYCDRYLVYEAVIDSLDRGAGDRIWNTFNGEPVTFVGFPSQNNNGAFVYLNTMLVIPKTSPNQEAAWHIIEGMLNDAAFTNMNYNGTGLPVTQKLLDKLYNDHDTLNESSIYACQNSETGEYIPQESVDQIYSYIQRVKIEPYFSNEIKNIVQEELDYVRGGERTPKQCVDILNDRIGTYMAENE